jgi:hypothetical protein
MGECIYQGNTVAAKRRGPTLEQQVKDLKKQNAILMMERNSLAALVRQLNDILAIIQKDLEVVREQFCQTLPKVQVSHGPQ